jgi:DNA polymerase I-like protein with 3'-5' exonuclease and polymerase domains
MGARIVMLIHDAIWIEAPTEEKSNVHHLTERIMSTAGRPFLDLKVDF